VWSADPTSLEVYVDGRRYENGDVIEYNSETHIDVMCTVSDGYPEPTFGFVNVFNYDDSTQLSVSVACDEDTETGFPYELSCVGSLKIEQYPVNRLTSGSGVGCSLSARLTGEKLAYGLVYPRLSDTGMKRTQARALYF